MKFSYNTVALVFDIIDKIFFRLGRNNPRKAIYNLIPNSSVNILDVCTGTGSNVIKIAKDKPNVKITGIDNSQGMLNVGLKKISKHKLNNINFLLQDAVDMQFESKSFDYALISLILHEMNKNTSYKTLQNTYNVLKDNGKLIVFEFIYPESKKFLPNLVFKLVKKVEDDNLFPEFLSYNKEEYFKNNGFKIDKIHKFQYTVIYELVKI